MAGLLVIAGCAKEAAPEHSPADSDFLVLKADWADLTKTAYDRIYGYGNGDECRRHERTESVCYGPAATAGSLKRVLYCLKQATKET